MTGPNLPTDDFDVFLSYNRHDLAEVQRIADELKRRDIRPWLDLEGILAGDDWMEVIDQVLRRTCVAAVCIGPRGLGPTQEKEAKALVNRHTQGKCRLIPVVLASVEQLPDLPLFLILHNFVDFRKDQPDPLDQLVRGIQAGSRTEASKVSVAGTAGVQNPLFQLPAALADFTGRDSEIAKLTARLRGDGGRVGISALRGMGGVGKTSLAVVVAHQVRDRFPDAQLFLDLRGTADQPVSAAEAMRRVIRAFHPTAGQLPDDEAELVPLYRGTLAGKRALLVLDNARDEEQVRGLLTAPPPAGFLVTSRQAMELDAVQSVPLDVLSEAEALALLREIVGHERGTDDELRAVAKLCGWLPLALRVAGSFLHLHPSWTLEQYRKALDAERLQRLKGKLKDHDVEAVLALSAAALVREDPELAGRWQMLSVFPASFAADAAAAVWELDEGPALDALTALLDRSLVLFDAKTRRYRLHELLRSIARRAFANCADATVQAEGENRSQIAVRRFAKHYQVFLEAAHSLYLKGNENILAGLALYDREAENIRLGMCWASELRAEEQWAAELCRDYPLTGAYILDLRLTARQQIDWLEIARAACQQLGDRRSEGQTLGNLGLAYADLGQAGKAIEFHEQDLQVTREIGDRRGEGKALGNLGNAYFALGQAGKAIKLYEQVLVVMREIGDRRGEGQTLGNLGLAYADLGQAGKAIELYEQVLAIAREIGDRRGEGNALGNLGNVYADLGQADKAVEFYSQHLRIAREIGDRRGEGNALGNLGNAYADLGQAGKAIEFHEQNLQVAREIGDRRGEGNALWNKALALDQLGRRAEALPLAEQALMVLEEIESPYQDRVRQTLAEWRNEAAGDAE